LRPLVLCTSPTHPFHGSLRQRLAAFGALHFTSFLFTIACFLNDNLR
jgi:hypothetical protein